MLKKLFAYIFFKAYKNILHYRLEESRQEENQFYIDYPPTDYEETAELIETNIWFRTLQSKVQKAETIEALTEIEDEWSENISDGGLPIILYELDEWLQGDLDDAVS